MKRSTGIFHIAVPCRDLDEAVAFYSEAIGARPARRYSDRVTFNFLGHQLVCHLSPSEVPASAKPYPRHFGITFQSRADFDALVQRLEEHPDSLLTPIGRRFEGLREEHEHIFVRDPSNNVLEFKWYHDPDMIY